MDLPLFSSPDSEWVLKYNQLMKDTYLKNKYDRKKRIKANQEYLNEFLPELKNVSNPEDKLVIDLGPGPGEFLEICRSMKFSTKGYDAPIQDCEMGDEYIRLSQLMSIRQKIDIKYDGAEDVSKFTESDGTVYLINSRGSIEQILKEHLVGVPHRVHKKATKLAWNTSSETHDFITNYFQKLIDMLEPGGILMMYGNGTSDSTNAVFVNIIGEIIKNNKLVTLNTDNVRLYKLQKPL